MGVNWSAGLMRWLPHTSRGGTVYGLSHVHPFRFPIELAARDGLPARTVEVHVGFSMHVFTCSVDKCGADPELYRDDRETRAFDLDRYERSRHLKGIIAGIEKRRCYFSERDAFLTVDLDGVPAGFEYRVFFSVRRRGADVVELLIRSAHLSSLSQRPKGQTRKPVGFRVIVGDALRGKRPSRPR